MAKQSSSRFRQKARIYFRRLRILVLFGLFLLMVGIIYLSHSGLPGFLQRPLLAQLRASGIDLEFRSLRLRWYRGLVADQVRLGHESTNGVLAFVARSADLNFQLSPLLHGKFLLDSIVIRSGRVEWRVGETNDPGHALVLDGIEAKLRLLPEDRWVLDDFRARGAGAQFILSGEITHASAMREWEMFRRATPAPAGSLRQRLRSFIERLELVSFGATPELRLHLEGDGRDQQSFHARLALQAPDAQTQWGRLTNALLTAVLYPATSNLLARVEAELAADSTATPWAEVLGFHCQLELGSQPGRTNQVSASVRADALKVVTPHAHGTNLQFTANWQQSLADVVPLSGNVALRVDEPTATVAGAHQLLFRASLAPGTYATVEDPAWSWWTNLAPYRLDWQSEVTGLHSEQGVAEKISLAGVWLAPMLVISNLHADLKDGPLDGSAQLDVDTQQATFQAASTFDVQQIRPFLRERSRTWLAKFSWGAQPPRLTGSGAIVLPAWTNRAPDWREDVLPTLRLAAELTVTNGAYLKVPADWAHTHITFTNMVWHLPDLRAGKAEGGLQLELLADDRTHEYLFRLQSTVDPSLLRPVLATNAIRGLEQFEFTERPVIAGEVRGRWREPERVGFQGTLALSNFTFRGQSMDSLTADLRYTNRVLEIFSPRVFRAGTQTVTAAGVTLDFDAQRAYFTNGFSTAEPLVVARCIGPKTGAGLEPYQFHQPPVVYVEGFAPLKTPGVADLRFKVDGGPFSWWRFNVPHIAGNARWRGDSLTLSDMQIEFYEGRAEGNASFALDDLPGTDFRFFLSVTNANLHRLMPDLFAQTNHLEGLLSGMLGITNANSADPNSWFGWTDFVLRDGLIWDMPILGLFSDVVNTVTPGLGRSRLSEATGRMGITNSVMHFDHVEMRAPLLRLQFRGTTDLAGNVDAIAEAEPLRDTPVFGPVMRLALKPMTKFFEYKVTGTLKQPKKEPLYIPARLLFMPFHPFQTLEDILNADGSTNAPTKAMGK